MNLLSRPHRSLALLAALAVLSTAPVATAAGKLDGTHTGTFTAKTDSPVVIGGSAPGTVTFTTLTRGNAKMVIEGTDVDKKPFTATFTLRSDGKVHTDAIVPGFTSRKGDGFWSLSPNGKVITMSLTSSQDLGVKLVIFQKGNLTVHLTAKVQGPHNKFRIRGTLNGSSNIGHVTGRVKFR